MQNRKFAEAPFIPRLIAYLLDGLILNLALLLVCTPLWAAYFMAKDILSKEILFQYSLMAIILYVLKKAYYVGMTYGCGRTLGKMALGLVVVNADGGKLKFLDVLIRETVGKFLSSFLYVGYLMALGREHLTLHDRICDTRVCYNGLSKASAEFLQSETPQSELQQTEELQNQTSDESGYVQEDAQDESEGF